MIDLDKISMSEERSMRFFACDAEQIMKQLDDNLSGVFLGV